MATSLLQLRKLHLTTRIPSVNTEPNSPTDIAEKLSQLSLDEASQTWENSDVSLNINRDNYELCMCGSTYERQDMTLICPTCGKISEMSAFGSEIVPDEAPTLVRCKGRQGKMVHPQNYDKGEQVAKSIREGFQRIEYRISEEIVQEIVRFILAIKDGTNRGAENDNYLVGATKYICNRKYNLNIHESAISRAFVKSGGVSPGYNRVIKEKFLLDYNDGNIDDDIVDQSLAVRMTTYNAAGKAEIPKKYFKFIYKLVTLQDLWSIQIDITISAKIAGSIYFFLVHVLGKNDIKLSISVSGVITIETAM